MERSVDIHWNGFIKQCCDNYPEESCAFLFAKTPFRMVENWFVFPVDNVAQDKTKLWIPDKKQLQKIKRKAKKLGLTKIGNVHSHPANLDGLSESEKEKHIEFHNNPSDTDLKYARKHNDVVRGILVVDDKGVYAHCFHDQFGNKLSDIVLEVTSNG